MRWVGTCLFCIGLVALAVLSTTPAKAQMYYWEIFEHSSNENRLQTEVTNFMENGFLPVGISFFRNKLTTFYLGKDILDASAWRIVPYASAGLLKSGIESMSESGYMPMGLSYTKGMFYVMFIQTSASFSRWAIIPSSLSLKSLKRKIRPYVKDGYIPFGLGSNRGQLLTLLVETDALDVSQYSVEAYPIKRKTIQTSIDRNIENGFKPWGFLHHGSQVFVVYLDF